MPLDASHAVNDGLGGRAARGAAVTITAQAARMMVQILGVVILSRLLDARDYGLLAMALSVITFGEIFRDFGLSSAAIQSPTLSRAERDNLFWLNTGIGVVLASLALAVAPLVAGIYGQPDLQPIVQALAAVFVLNGLTTQYRAGLVRGLRFRAVAAAEVGSAALGLAVAVVCALGGLQYWAIVVQQLTAAGTLLLGMALAGRWLPRLYTRGVPMRRFVRFGAHLLGSQIVGYAANNVDTWLIGVRFGPTVLGFYNRAFQFLMTPMNQVRSPSTTVALPVLSKLSDDQPRFDRFVRQGQLALALPVGIAMATVAGCASAIVPVVLTEEWSASIPYLRLFAVAAMFQTLAYVGYWIYLARGLTDVLLRYSIVAAVVKVGCILVGSQWGPLGVAAGYAAAPMIEWPISLWWLGRNTQIPRRALYGNALRIVAQSVPVGAAAYAASTASASSAPWISLMLGIVAAVATYFLLVLLVPDCRRDLDQVRTMALLVRRRSARGGPGPEAGPGPASGPPDSAVEGQQP